jgi:O-antigen ligase
MNSLSLRERLPESPEWALLALCSAIAAGIAVAVAGPMASIALLVGLFAIAGAVAAPGIVLAAYLLIEFYKGALQADSPIDITVFLALANAIQLVPLLFDSRPRAVSRVGIVLWLSLGLLVLGGVLYAPDQSLAVGNAVTYWALIILPIFPAAMRVGSEPRHVKQFLWTFFAMGIATVAIGLTQLSGSARLVVLGMNTIQVSLAALLVPLLGIAYVLPQRRLLASIVTVVLIPASFVVAIASGSRGPLLVLMLIGAAGAIGYLARLHAVRWRLVGGVAGLALASVVVVSITAPSLPAQSLGRFASLEEFIQSGLSGDAGVSGGETSAATRVQLFQFAIEMFEERPLIGAGTGGFEAMSLAALGPGADTYPHNAILQVAAEFGLLGLAPFLGVVFIGLFRPLPGRYAGLAIRALFLFFLLNAMVSGDIFSDRETLGALFLILAIEAPRAVTASASRQISPEPPLPADEPAPTLRAAS